MIAGSKITRIGAALLLSAALCGSSVGQSSSAPKRTHTKKKKAKPEVALPQLPSGPTGRPVQQMPLDSIAAVAPQVSYQNNQLTIVAPNSTLAEILRAVKKQTGAEIEVPAAPERVVTHLGPGPARDVVAELLNGSRFNYVLLGSPADDSQLTRVVLVAKGPADTGTSQPQIANSQPNAPQITSAPPQQDGSGEATEVETVDDSNANTPEDNPEQAAGEGEQPPATPDQPGVKTPQQMLEEMQQRQMQLQQQQQQNGQTPQPTPNPSTGMPPHPPQQQ